MHFLRCIFDHNVLARERAYTGCVYRIPYYTETSIANKWKITIHNKL